MSKVNPTCGALALVGLVAACSSSSSTGPATEPDGVDAAGTGSLVDAAGTGSSGDAGAGPTSCPGSAVSWKDDGVLVCPSSWVASGLHGGVPGSPDDTVEIVVTQGTTVGLGISVAHAPPLGGTYDCTFTSTGGTEITYRDAEAAGTIVDSCSVTVNLVVDADAGGDAGVTHAVGTFSAVLSLVDGGPTKNLTDGVFDVVVNY